MNISLAKTALKKYFGYDNFRPMQAEIIASIYDKCDALVLMPTGGGKSICYQIPAITLEGACVVVSPLISLMKDQVEGLRANGIKAAFLNSSLGMAEQRSVENDFFNGAIDLLYVSPEKVTSQDFLPLLQKARINLFAIDEAHCISAWGHDFRPEYTQMRFLKNTFPDVPIIALTATADKVTRKDIAKQLHLDDPKIFIASFDRPNLSLEVRPGQRRFDQILAFIKKRPNQSGIIYCLSRKQTEDIARKLNGRGIKAAHYHAGLADYERSEVQEAFIKDDIPIISATIAFGMGIDKSNVRWIIHYNLPKNVESYYQEIGRAGRDGVQADTLLFYSYGDVMVLQDILRKNGGKNLDIQLAKLDRIRQYADSASCRRRILLNYFGENLAENCGNCDVCKNPPEHFDGTTLAQKALSAIYRLREKVGMGLVIDVLRGSGKREIMERGYQHIKTYGAGRDLGYLEWQNYLLQLLNLGYIEIAHDQKNVVKLTPASNRILFEKAQVQLVKIATLKERKAKEKAKAKPVTQRQRSRNELFEVLRQLRRKLAQEKGVPPYIIFSDATLEEMAAMQPMNDDEMRKINGVGERKLHLYGNVFIDAILDFVGQQSSNFKESTFKVTHELHQKGWSVERIATQRELNPSTIFTHLAQLYENGEEVDVSQMISQQEIKAVTKLLSQMEEPYRLKPIFDALEGNLDYAKIRLALAVHRREQ